MAEKAHLAVRAVDHPWSKIMIALMSTGAFAGMGTGFWGYLQTKETTKLEMRQAELSASSANTDTYKSLR